MSIKSTLQLIATTLIVILTISITIAWRAEQQARAQLEQQLKSAQAQITAAARQSARNAALNQQLAQLQKSQAITKSPNEILNALPNVLPLLNPLILQAAPTRPQSNTPVILPALSEREAWGTRFAAVASRGPHSSLSSITDPCASATGAPPVAQASACVPTGAPPPVPKGESSRNSRSPTGSDSSPATPIILPTEDLKPLYDHAIQCKECQLRLATAQANLKDEQAKTAAVSRELTDALRASKGGSALRRVTRAAKWFVVGAAIGAAATKLSH